MRSRLATLLAVLIAATGLTLTAVRTFASVFGSTIGQVRALTGKPILLSETAAGPNAGQCTKISDLFSGMRRYRTPGLVWFDKVQRDGIYHQDWRIENDPQATAAFRLGLSELNLARRS
jgi:hypothetical protein